ncbi:MAG: hypothetical protein Q9163_004880 [Psora crenata]
MNGGRGRKHYNTRDGSGDTTSSQHLLKSSSPTATSAGSGRLSRASGSDVSNSRDPLIGRLRRWATHPKEEKFSQESLKPHPLQTHAAPLDLFQSPIPDVTDSPAANALRKLTRSATAGSTSDPAIARRKSGTDSAKLGGLHRGLVSGERKGAGNNLMPAIITLRKASEALFPKRKVDLASLVTQGDPYPSPPSPLPENPTSELIAFRSTSVVNIQPAISSSHLSPGDFLSGVSSDGQGKENQDRRKSVLAFEAFSETPRSTAAGSAITLADVHIAPGTFTLDRKSRKPSMVSRRSPCPLSVVQFRSHSSVHEVIWREDESTSESGSSKIVSPGQNDQVSYISSASQANPPKQPRTASLNHNGLLGIDLEPSFGIDENLFHWSWGSSPFPCGDSKAETLSQRVGPKQHFVDEVRKELSRYAVTRKDRRSSLSLRSSVQFFPPLGDRKSTAEWRQTSLVDLYADSAGRQTELPRQATADCEGAPRADVQSAVMNWAANQRGKGMRKLSTHPYAPARVAETGTIGSSLGSSSHRRLNQDRLSA